jgi:hypothetical protein
MDRVHIQLLTFIEAYTTMPRSKLTSITTPRSMKHNNLQRLLTRHRGQVLVNSTEASFDAIEAGTIKLELCVSGDQVQVTSGR